jgi:tetratricopeptide (TPR) repeat protein
MAKWKPFPHDNSGLQFNGEKLKQAWKQLHAGDCEPFPAERTLQQAWRCFHQGDFQQAVILGDELGVSGHAVANKATGVYATYLEENESRQAECFMEAIKRAEKAIEALPEDPNSHYFHAFNLGRYSQSISVTKALKQGLGGKIQKSLKRALQLQPKHAEAHTAMGMYHAEIINKIGKLVGSLTYGANDKEALRHFETAIKLTPSSPIAHIEYGNGLYLLYGDSRLDEVTDLYAKAAEMDPRDAMEKLDVESARAEFE